MRLEPTCGDEEETEDEEEGSEEPEGDEVEEAEAEESAERNSTSMASLFAVNSKKSSSVRDLYSATDVCMKTRLMEMTKFHKLSAGYDSFSRKTNSEIPATAQRQKRKDRKQLI